jgi:hypothetical protein
MAEIEHFLKQDWRFAGYVEGLRRVSPGQERDSWLDTFFKSVWRYGHYVDEEVLIRSRVYQACVYTTLYDEDEADSEGLAKELQDVRREAMSSFFDPSRGWVSKSLVPYKLGQCERTYGPSHVEDGGGVALEPAPLCCEKPLGPSRDTGDATQRSSDDDQGMDRSSPVQSSGPRAESDSHNVDTGSESLP